MVCVSSPILELTEVGHAGLKRTAIFDGLSQGVQSLGYSPGQAPRLLGCLGREFNCPLHTESITRKWLYVNRQGWHLP